MTEVYVVCRGEDYPSPVAIYTERNLADLCASRSGGVVETWPLNPDREHFEAGEHYYSLATDRAGEIRIYEAGSPAGEQIPPYRLYNHGNLSLWCWAADEQAARDQIDALRQELIASGDWDRVCLPYEIDWGQSFKGPHGRIIRVGDTVRFRASYELSGKKTEKVKQLSFGLIGVTVTIGTGEDAVKHDFPLSELKGVEVVD